MNYILKISNKAFIKVDNDELIILQDPDKATKFEKIGYAMRTAGQINNDLNVNIVKVVSYE